MWLERSTMVHDPSVCAINLALSSISPTTRLVRRYAVTDVGDVHGDIASSLRKSDSPRCKTYVEINPILTLHSIYNTRHKTNEIHKKSLTRFRVISHNLTCETGRWDRLGRPLPLHECVYVSGVVETVAHLVENFPNTRHLREHCQFTMVH